MATSRWGRAGVAVAAALVAMGISKAARSEELFGNAQIQFQRVETTTAFLDASGALGSRRVARELWMQSYDVNHRAYPRENVLLQSTLRLSQIHYPSSGD